MDLSKNTAEEIEKAHRRIFKECELLQDEVAMLVQEVQCGDRLAVMQLGSDGLLLAGIGHTVDAPVSRDK